MSYLFDTAQNDFERFLTTFMPNGARLTQADADYQPLDRAGTPALLVSQAVVLDVGIAQDGVYYRVAFGPGDVYGPAAQEQMDPAVDAWTLNLTDPVAELASGLCAIEMLDVDGHPFDPEQWLLINPNVRAEDLEALIRGR